MVYVACARRLGYRMLAHFGRGTLEAGIRGTLQGQPGGGMEPRITVITLAVEDLDRAVAFYRDGLGWPTQGIVGREFPDGAVVFFDLANGLKLALWPRVSLARDAGVEPGPGSPTELSLGHNVRSPADVDAAYGRVVAAGGIGIREPHPTFWGGYAAYVQDPDGHLWELVFNPGLLPPQQEPEGNVRSVESG